MCLEKKEELRIPLNKQGEGIGWKGFHEKEVGERLCIPLQGNEGEVSINTWLKEKDYRYGKDKERKYLRVNSHLRYQYGFHLFQHKKDTLKWKKASGWPVIKKVRFRKIVATGYQKGFWGDPNLYPCIVAKEILILKR